MPMTAQIDELKESRHPTKRDYSKVGMVYAYGVNYSSACKHYRLEMPIQKMAALGFTSGVIKPIKKSLEEIADIMSSDILLLYAIAGKGIEHTLDDIEGAFANSLKKEYPAYVPPTIIWDTDDNQDWVHPLNPSFVNLGTRNIDGSPLSPGDIIWAQHYSGEKRPLWIDEVSRIQPDPGGEVLFDIRRNIKTLKSLRRVVQRAHGVTTASPYLTKYFKEHYGVEHIHTFHNSIDPADYEQTKFTPREDVRIFWQGGDSHAPDMFPIREPLTQIIAKNGHTKFYVWGAVFTWVTKEIKPEQLVTMKWLSYDGYIPVRSRLDVDINICPLVDSEFNRSKSCIKWYEASLSGTPEATLAANVSPYKDEIIDGETGMLYSSNEEFAEKLQILIDNSELRRMLGENAKKWVIENRHYKVTVPPLYEFLSECRLRHTMSYGVG